MKVQSAGVGFNEKDFVLRACKGDKEAFSKLYEKYARRIYAVCERMTCDPTLAEDLVQETFLSAFRKLHTFRGDSLFSTWLHRIAVNNVLMYFRQQKVTPTAHTVDERLEPEEDEPIRDRFITEDHRLLQTASRLQLERAVSNLPPGYRIMFVLHDIEGYEHSEIAALLGCSPGNTKSQLHKARKRLREILNMGEQLERPFESRAA